ncbi:hypothetical protein [Candidatus Liberibacter americanus]|nr:hypothetical protein [Candidatus Liberibacter americanus]
MIRFFREHVVMRCAFLFIRLWDMFAGAYASVVFFCCECEEYENVQEEFY